MRGESKRNEVHTTGKCAHTVSLLQWMFFAGVFTSAVAVGFIDGNEAQYRSFSSRGGERGAHVRILKPTERQRHGAHVRIPKLSIAFYYLYIYNFNFNFN